MALLRLPPPPLPPAVLRRTGCTPSDLNQVEPNLNLRMILHRPPPAGLDVPRRRRLRRVAPGPPRRAGLASESQCRPGPARPGPARPGPLNLFTGVRSSALMDI